jgi:hypothetical protein
MNVPKTNHEVTTHVDNRTRDISNTTAISVKREELPLRVRAAVPRGHDGHASMLRVRRVKHASILRVRRVKHDSDVVHGPNAMEPLAEVVFALRPHSPVNRRRAEAAYSEI